MNYKTTFPEYVIMIGLGTFIIAVWIFNWFYRKWGNEK